MSALLPAVASGQRPNSSLSNTPQDRVPPFLYWALLWGFGAVIPIVSLGADIFLPQLQHVIGRDFTNLYAAGRLVLEGRPDCAFDPNCFRLALQRHAHILSLQNYSYPPQTLLIAVPFALLPYHLALIVWSLLGAAFFMWAAKPYLPPKFPALLAILTPGALFNLWNGHYGFFFGGFWLLCFEWLRRKPTRSGVMAGLLTFKPHLGILVAVAMLTRRRALLSTIATTIALVIASAILFGPATWFAFLTATFDEQVGVLTRTTGDFYFRMMPSAYVVFGHRYGILAQILFALVTIGLLARARVLEPFVFATATFLLVPYAFNYDMTVACLGFAIVLFRTWSRMTLIERSLLSIAFLVPEITYLGSVVPLVVPPALLGALCVQLKYARETATESGLEGEASEAVEGRTASPSAMGNGLSTGNLL